MSALSIVQDSGAPALLSTAARDFPTLAAGFRCSRNRANSRAYPSDDHQLREDTDQTERDHSE
jgi:hypothetical protein